MCKYVSAILSSFLLLCSVCGAQFTPVGPPQAVPLGDVVFVLDRSGSISSSEFTDMVLSISGSLGTSIPHNVNYRVAVVAFNSSTLSGPDIPFMRANDPALDTALAALAVSGTTGGTDVSTGMAVAHDLLSTKSNAYSKHVIVLTDADYDQVGTSIAIAKNLRDNYDTRTSVGYLRGDCSYLTMIPDCITDLPSVAARGVYTMAQIANAPINPPLVMPPYGIRLWGVLNCIDDQGDMVSQYEDLIAEALCPFGLHGAPDADNNLIPDVCDIFIDCDGNGVHDAFDPDCDGDMIPDACEKDCDSDGIPNGCDPTPGHCLYECPPIPVGGGE